MSGNLGEVPNGTNGQYARVNETYLVSNEKHRDILARITGINQLTDNDEGVRRRTFEELSMSSDVDLGKIGVMTCGDVILGGGSSEFRPSVKFNYQRAKTQTKDVMLKDCPGRNIMIGQDV